jgi:hypothetical protein
MSRRSFHTVLVACVLGEAFWYVSRVGSGGCGLRTRRARDRRGGVARRDASTELAGLSGLPCAVHSICTTVSGHCTSASNFDRSNVASGATPEIGRLGDVATERILHTRKAKKCPFHKIPVQYHPGYYTSITRS